VFAYVRWQVTLYDPW